MRYLLDTNTCIRYLNGRAPNIKARLATVPETDVVLCSIVKAELAYGAQRSQNPDKSAAIQSQFTERFVSLPFDDRAASFYAVIRADLTARGTPIGPNDLLIAAIAVAHGLILVTHNTSEFGRVRGLKVEDWEL